jgi:putative transposase
VRHGTESLCGINQIYQAATQEQAEANLIKLEETWDRKYGAEIRSWQNNWEDLSTFFEFPQEIRRLIYTTNTVAGNHRQLRKVLKNKKAFPPEQAVRKLLYLVTRDIIKKWTAPIRNWPLILN